MDDFTRREISINQDFSMIIASLLITKPIHDFWYLTPITNAKCYDNIHHSIHRISFNMTNDHGPYINLIPRPLIITLRILSTTLFTNPLLQHTIQTLTKCLLNPHDPPPVLPLHHLVIIILQLANKRQHLRQALEPLLAQPGRERLLALDDRQPDRRLLGPQVLEQRRVDLLVVLLAVGGSGELDDGED